jgi:hypothetical protein
MWLSCKAHGTSRTTKAINHHLISLSIPVRVTRCDWTDTTALLLFDVFRMHHCLRIPEIVGLWCSHLEESSTIGLQAYSTIVGKSWKRPALNDLAVVARTCRAFHGPALDALWRSSALVNVLRCMPSDLYHCKQSGPSWNVKCDMVSPPV